MKIDNIDKLRPEAAEDVRKYVQELLGALGQDAESALAFGSVTGSDYVPGESNINLAFLVRTAELPLLERCLLPVSAGFKKRIVAPLFLTREYVARSQDVFPVEFLDMRETGVLLFGEDFLAGLKLAPAWLRLECEQQLKSSLLRTRQAFLEIGRSKGGLEKIAAQSLNSLVPLCRAVLALRGRALPRTKLEIVTALCRELGLSDAAFTEILGLRARGVSLKPGRGVSLLADYVAALEKLIAVVDTFKVEDAQ